MIMLMFALISGLKPTPEIEICFAFSATGTDSGKTSMLMKNTINKIIDKYGAVKLHYLAVVFGTQARTEISFRDQNLNDQALISYISRIRQPSGSPRLDIALQEAKKAFDESPRRPGVKRVLVVFIDNKSVGDTDDMKKLQAAKELYGGDVSIITVAIGEEADPNELGKVTSRKDNLIKESKDVDPGELAKQIMEKTFGGKSLICELLKQWYTCGTWL